jgi:aminoglycoside phosphotransferase (APT) family kinase protein
MGSSSASATPSRPAADEIAAPLEPIACRNIPGAADACIANWRSAERGLSTETFLFDLQQGRDEGPTTLKQLVFRLYPDYDLTRQVMAMNRLRDTPIAVPVVCWLDRDDKDLGTPYYVMEQLPTIGTASAPAGTGRRVVRRVADVGLAGQPATRARRCRGVVARQHL